MIIRKLMLAAAALVVACDPTAPEKELNLSIKVQGSTPTFFEVREGEQQIRCGMTFTGIPSGSEGVVATWDGGERRWFAGAEPDTPWQVDVLTGDQVGEFWQAKQIEEGTRITTNWEFWASAPFIVEHEFRYRVDGEVRSASVKKGCGVGLNEASPPSLSNVAIEFGEPTEPRYSDVRIHFDVVAPGKLWEARILVQGAFEETIVIPGDLVFNRSFENTLWIPSDATLGVPFTVSVLAVDALGQTSEVVSKTSPAVVDLTPPTIESFARKDWYGERLAGQWSVGELMQLSVGIAENHQVAALEFEANAHKLVIERTAESGPIPEFTVPSEWLGTTSVTLRARDMQGNWSALVQSVPDSFRIFPVNSYPANVWTDDNAEFAIAWDDARDRVFVATEDGEVIVLATPGLTVTDRIALQGGRIGSVDFTPGGDSLVVTFPDQGRVGFVDLQSHTVREIDVAEITGGLRPWRALVLNNNTVLMALSDPAWDWRAAVFDVGTGAFNLELPAAYGLTIARSADRSLASAYDDACVYLYHPGASAFEICIANEGFNPSLTVNARGTHAASGDRLIDTGTRAVSSGTWGLLGGRLHLVAAPAGDGQSLFMSDAVGVVRVRASDGVVLERIAELRDVRQILLSADGTRMILLSEDQLSPSVRAVIRHLQIH